MDSSARKRRQQLFQFAISDQRIPANDRQMQRPLPIRDGQYTPDKFITFEIS
jgi:hypothetical protein